MGCAACGKSRRQPIVVGDRTAMLRSGRCPNCGSYVARKMRKLPNGTYKAYYKCLKGHRIEE